MCELWGRGLCLLDLQTAACGNLGSLLRHRQRQNAVSVGSLDTVNVDTGDVKATAVRTVVTLTLYEVVLLVLLILVDLSLGADGQAIVLDVYLDILLLEAGQLSLELVGIAGVGNIGAEGSDRRHVSEEAALHIVKGAERIESGNGMITAIKRNKFKHNIYTSKIYLLI